MEDELSPNSSLDGQLQDFLITNGIFKTGGGGKSVAKYVDDDENGGFDDVYDEEENEDEDEGDYEEVNVQLQTTSSSLVVDTVELLLPSCVKVSRILSERGYEALQLTKGDINMSTRSISVFVVDSWAESILVGMSELTERLSSQQAAVKDSAMSVRKREVTHEALEGRVRELQEKLFESERKGKLSEARVKRLEGDLDLNSKRTKTDDSEAKRGVKNLELKNQV